MAQQVKIKVRPGQVVHFPGLCVACARPAADHLPLRKRIGRLTRLVDVPICSACAAELQRRSAEEERRQKIGYLAAGLAFVVVAAALLLLLPALGLALRLAAALGLGVLAASAARAIFQPAALRAARPEKQAILNAARLASFSWRASTFEFANDAFADRFVDLNRHLLMEPARDALLLPRHPPRAMEDS